MFPNSIAAFGSKDDKINRDQYAADFQQQTNNVNNMLQMLRCKAYNSTPQVIPTAAATALVFDTDIHSIGFPALHFPSLFAIGARFTAQADGFYMFVGQVGFPAFVGTVVALSVMVNGILDTGGNARGRSVPNAAAASRTQVIDVRQLAYGDYAEFLVTQDSGGNLNTEVSVTWGSATLLSRL